MGLIIEISSIVMLWTGVFDSVDIAPYTLANRVTFSQQNFLNLLVFHDINNSSMSYRAYCKSYLILFLKH